MIEWIMVGSVILLIVILITTYSFFSGRGKCFVCGEKENLIVHIEKYDVECVSGAIAKKFIAYYHKECMNKVKKNPENYPMNVVNIATKIIRYKKKKERERREQEILYAKNCDYLRSKNE